MRTVLLILLMIMMATMASAQWAATTPMNDSRYGLDAVKHQDDIYVVGGWDGDQTLECLSGGSWMTMANLPTGQAGVCAALVDDYIYTFGDYGPNDTVQIYDINNDSWSAGPNLPTPLYWATAEAVGHRVYVIGGYSPPTGNLNTVQILDTNTNSWSYGTPCPVTMQRSTSAKHGSYIYVFGAGGDYRYDYNNDAWTAIATRPYQTQGASAECIGDIIYVLGGNYGPIYEAYPYTQKYDIATNSWTMGPDQIFARYQLTSGYVNDYLYSIGGRDANGGAQDWVERLHVPTTPPPLVLALWPQTSTIPAGGGIVYYAADVTNNTGALQIRQAWTMLTLPNSNVYGPLMLNWVGLPPGTISVFQQQNIPGWAPPGNYIFHGYLGYYGSSIVDASDSFPFSKLTMGAGDVHDWHATDWPSITADDEPTGSTPTEFRLSEPYPNPFNARATFSVDLPQSAELTVNVYNVVGQQVAVLARGNHTAGTVTLTFDASTMSAGVYFIHANTGNWNAIRKAILLK